MSPFDVGVTELFQSTLSMRRATFQAIRIKPDSQISIHALHEESDMLLLIILVFPFLISIHALHEESDLHRTRRRTRFRHFNPRSP